MLDQTKERQDAMAGDAAASGAPHPLSEGIPVRHKDDAERDAEYGQGDEGSLVDDVSALYEDGKTYVSSELAFQKSRATYAAKASPKVAAFGFGAYMLLNLALIALTVGAILSLETLVGPLAATLIVTAALLVGAGILGYMAKSKAAEISRVFSGGKP